MKPQARPPKSKLPKDRTAVATYRVELRPGRRAPRWYRVGTYGAQVGVGWISDGHRVVLATAFPLGTRVTMTTNLSFARPFKTVEKKP